jgi:hypothetical protein
MADHGTVTFQDADPVYEVTGYTLAGAGGSGPTVPTTGQVWPRGAG